MIYGRYLVLSMVRLISSISLYSAGEGKLKKKNQKCHAQRTIKTTAYTLLLLLLLSYIIIYILHMGLLRWNYHKHRRIFKTYNNTATL